MIYRPIMNCNNILYAPVVIPTLCRFDTFKLCIESLSNCIGAEHTEVFVGLDYPLKESHWEGYKKIKEYLQNATFRFLELHVLLRDHNCGVSGPESNAALLINDVLSKFDTYIFSEDDCVFAPNFLVYINKGLEKFKDDMTVESITGYMHYTGIDYDKNTYFRNPLKHCAWGTATWKDRVERRKIIDSNYFRKTFSFSLIHKMRKLGRHKFLAYLNALIPKEYVNIIDVIIGLYMNIEGLVQIVPTKVSLVRNIGATSGENFSRLSGVVSDYYLQQPLSENHDFEYIGSGNEKQQENVRRFVRYERYFDDTYYWFTRRFFIKKVFRYVGKIILSCLSRR